MLLDSHHFMNRVRDVEVEIVLEESIRLQVSKGEEVLNVKSQNFRRISANCIACLNFFMELGDYFHDLL